MSGLTVVLLIVVITALGISIVFLIPHAKLGLNDRIQFSLLIVLAATLVGILGHYATALSDADLRQRPFVGRSEISAIFLGGKQKQSELDKEDEIAFLLKFENLGLSTAKVEYVKMKIYYGILSDNTTEKSTGAKPTLELFSMIPSPKETPVGDDTIPTPNRAIMTHTILLPQQSTTWSALSHALTLKERLFITNPSRPCPIVVESEIKYQDLKGTTYFHHSRYLLTWAASFYNHFVAQLAQSTDKEQPLHLTSTQFSSFLKNLQEDKKK